MCSVRQGKAVINMWKFHDFGSDDLYDHTSFGIHGGVDDSKPGGATGGTSFGGGGGDRGSGTPDDPYQLDPITLSPDRDDHGDNDKSGITTTRDNGTTVIDAYFVTWDKLGEVPWGQIDYSAIDWAKLDSIIITNTPHNFSIDERTSLGITLNVIGAYTQAIRDTPAHNTDAINDAAGYAQMANSALHEAVGQMANQMKGLSPAQMVNVTKQIARASNVINAAMEAPEVIDAAINGKPGDAAKEFVGAVANLGTGYYAGALAGGVVMTIGGVLTAPVWASALAAAGVGVGVGVVAGSAAEELTEGFLEVLGTLAEKLGQMVDEQGTRTADTIRGEHTPDFINAYQGDDVIHTYGGNDMINAGSGDDVIDPGWGRDVIHAGDGNDVIMGGSGADTYHGGAGSDTVSYENANSSVNVSLATAKSWFSNTYTEIENLDGSTYADVLRGNQGNSILRGNGGNDQIFGGRDKSGNDTLIGGVGDDTLYGENGSDRLRGDEGNDILYGDSILFGDGKKDVFIFTLNGDTDRIKGFQDNIDVIELRNFGLDDFAQVRAQATQNGDDVVINLGGGDRLIIEDIELGALRDDMIFG